jgi:DmsE family decaheme c-type cytochrome
MTCSSCHDVHATTEAQLRTKQRVSDLCFECHQEKEGPFVFEHAPVQEDCRTCHTAHGSVANNLLTANEPMLCLQCHEFHFHAGYRAADEPVHIGNAMRQSPYGARSFNVGFTTKCTQCHSRVHGSDLPSQTVTGRGRGLTR